MALRMAMKRAFASSALFSKSKLMSHQNPNPAAAAAVASLSRRPFSSSIPVIDSNDETCTIVAHGGSFTRSEEFPIHRGVSDQYMENPFQVSGPRGSYAAKKIEEGLFIRMEMPGIEKEDVKLCVEYGTVSIKGEGKRESKHDEGGRAYSASIELCSDAFQPEKIKAEMKNGILRLVIPKAKNSESTSGLFEVKIK